MSQPRMPRVRPRAGACARSSQPRTCLASATVLPIYPRRSPDGTPGPRAHAVGRDLAQWPEACSKLPLRRLTSRRPPPQEVDMAVRTTTKIDPRRVEELTQRELASLNDRTQGSAAMYERARSSLSGGVASSYQLRDPWPIYLS